MRGRILSGQPRIDGRDTRTVRPITVRVGVLPRTHGSALFTRGETQALVITTLGTDRDAQIIDAIGGLPPAIPVPLQLPALFGRRMGQVCIHKRRKMGPGQFANAGCRR